MPIRDILLDSSGNRVLAGGDYGRADGAQAVKQGIECRLRLFLAEYWLDQSQGVDYFGQILVRSPNEIVVVGDLSRAIAATPDVTRVANTSYSVNSTGRSASVSYSAASTEGLVVGEVVAP